MKGCFYEKNKQSHKHNAVGIYAYANDDRSGFCRIEITDGFALPKRLFQTNAVKCRYHADF